MKKHVFCALLGVALSAPVAVLAAQADHSPVTGHYEWKSIPQYGPRATGPAQKRVWVPDAQMANCACDMMKMNAKACMKGMPGIGSSSAGSAG